MLNEIHRQLEPLCRRERTVQMIRRLTPSVLLGAMLAIVMAAPAVWLGDTVLRLGAWTALLAGVGCGVVAAMLIKKDWLAAARAVDARFKLADRTLTALSCAAVSPERPAQQLQVRDALAHLQRVNPREAARQQIDWKRTGAAAALLVIAIVLSLWPAVEANQPPVLDEPLKAAFVPKAVSTPAISADVAASSLKQLKSSRDDRGSSQAESALGRAAQVRSYFDATQQE